MNGSRDTCQTWHDSRRLHCRSIFKSTILRKRVVLFTLGNMARSLQEQLDALDELIAALEAKALETALRTDVVEYQLPGGGTRNRRRESVVPNSLYFQRDALAKRLARSGVTRVRVASLGAASGIDR